MARGWSRGGKLPKECEAAENRSQSVCDGRHHFYKDVESDADNVFARIANGIAIY